MSSNVGKKNIAHKGSGHGCVAPAAVSLVTPPAPPAPTPFPYVARASNASDTASKLKVAGNEVLVEGSTMSLDPPANQPAQSGGGDVVTHATKNIAVMTMGSFAQTVCGKGVCATGDIAALNVITKQSKVAQMSMPLLEAADFEAARKAALAAAAAAAANKRAHPPSKANQCRGGHPVDLGTGYVVDDAVDLHLPGFIPLKWSRSYSSSAHLRRGALGKGGWTHSFEQCIEVTDTGFRFQNDEGLPIELGPLADDGISFHRGQRLELRKSGPGFEIRSLANRLIRTFAPLPSGRIALRSIGDSRGHRIDLEYQGNTLVRIVDSAKREIRIASDAKGRVTRVEVWAGEPGSGAAPSLQVWFDYAYYPEGELASHTNALGYAETWAYDGLHRMVKTTLRNGVSFYYEYHPELGYCARTWGDDGLHDVGIEIDFEKGETRTSRTNRARRYLWKNGVVHREETFDGSWAVERIYDEDELLVVTRNGAEEGTTYEYDERGNLITETDAAGNRWQFEYHDDVPIRRVTPTGLETQYKHDDHRSLTGVTFANGLSYLFERDREGQLTAVLGREGAPARLAYDEQGNPCQDISGRGAVTSYRYNALGWPVEQKDPLGRPSRLVYDVMGRVLEIVRADGTRVSVTYDPIDNIATITNPLGQTTFLEYAGTGQPARITQADGQVYHFAYDSDERLIRIMNPRMETYEFDYDRADQIVAERTFDGRLIEYRHDRAGRVRRIDFPEGEWREIAYDKLGNVVEDRGEDVQIAFTRDALGHIEKAVSQDLSGKVVTEFERDRLGRVVADIQNGRAVRYEYDAQDRRNARVLPDGQRTEYHYDSEDGAFAGISHDGYRMAIQRDLLGRERTRQGATWKLDFEYDTMDRLLSQRVGRGGGPPIVERRYEYDVNGRVSSIDSLRGGLTTYRYDRIDQLVEAARRGRHEAFEYDPTGSLVNMLEQPQGPPEPTWSLAAGNQLRATNRARYVNDGRGRRIQRIDRAAEDSGPEGALASKEHKTIYGWDSDDRLREVVLPDSSRVRFTYDAFGRRVKKEVLIASPAGAQQAAWTLGDAKVNRRVVHYLWDGGALCEEIDTAKEAPVRVHVHLPGTLVPLLQAEQGEVFAVVCDHLGMPKELLGQDGRMAWEAAHSAWGRVVGVERYDDAHKRAQPVESPFRLLGQYHDDETGLCYTRFRYFDALHGRWLSPDPLGIGGGRNLLAFDGTPTFAVDPLGLACVTKTLCLGLGEHLDKFAVGRGLTYQNWTTTEDSPGLTRRFWYPEIEFDKNDKPIISRNFGRVLNNAAENAEEIHFNLDGIADPVASADMGKKGFVYGRGQGEVTISNATNAELNVVRTNPAFLKKTTFYRNGAVVPNPFLPGGQ